MLKMRDRTKVCLKIFGQMSAKIIVFGKGIKTPCNQQLEKSIKSFLGGIMRLKFQRYTVNINAVFTST